MKRLRTLGSDESGFALIYVVGVMLTVTLFLTATLAYVAGSTQDSRKDQDFNAALAAAQAGVDDYIAALNRNDNYARQSPFTDCSNTAIKGPKAPSPNTCGWTATTAVGWQRVDPGNAARGSFHYDVATARLAASGIVDLTSSGKVGTNVRTLQVAVARGGTTDFLYYTDHEDGDPANTVEYPNQNMNADCYSYWWGQSPDAPPAARSPRKNYSGSDGCAEITFIGGDVLNGPVHTNDTPLLTNSNGTSPSFQRGLETSDPACQRAVNGQTDTYKYCDRYQNNANYNGIAPKYAAPLYLQDNSSTFASDPGCQYTGATRIIFQGATMRVWSKSSRTTAACGGTAPMGVSVAVPSDRVIYVQGDGTSPHVCKSGEIDGASWPLGNYTGSNTTTTGYTYDTSMLQKDQYCGQGNAYVEGTLKGRVTVAAQNSVAITGDLQLQGGLNGTDLLGLVAGNSVEVVHPLVGTIPCVASVGSKCTQYDPSNPQNVSEVTSYPVRYSPSVAGSGIEINASIQSLQHSFFVQQYNAGTPKGKLVVDGSIAQKWRGAVGANSNGNLSTGYLKQYNYDARLEFTAPPYFPQFLNAKWQPRTTGEIPPRY